VLGRERALGGYVVRHALRAVELVDCSLEAGEVGWLAGRCDLEVVCDLFGAVDYAREGADDDVGDSLSFEGGDERVRVEQLLVPARRQLPSGAHHPLDPALGREERVLPELGDRVLDAVGEFERQVEAADSEYLEQRLEAGC
jgi:hypothetical protein